MSSHNHREPGIVCDVRSWWNLCWINSYGHHIDNNVILEAFKVLGFNKIIVVSDFLSAKVLNDGNYYYDGFNITKKRQMCYLQESKKIAGNAFSYLDIIIKQIKKISKCCLSDIVKISSYNFYKSVGLSCQYGCIQENYIADVILLIIILI